MFFGGFRPLQDEIEPEAVLLLERERRFVHRLRTALGDNFLEIRQQPFGVLERILPFLGFILEADLQAFVDIARHLEPLANDRGVELDLREDRGVWPEEYFGAASASRADLLRRSSRRALLEPLFPLAAVTANRRDQFLR